MKVDTTGKPNDIVPISEDPRHQPGAPLTTYEKRTIGAFLVVPIAVAALIGPPLALVAAGVTVGPGAIAAGLVPGAGKDAFIGVSSLMVILMILSPLLAILGRR